MGRQSYNNHDERQHYACSVLGTEQVDQVIYMDVSNDVVIGRAVADG